MGHPMGHSGGQWGPIGANGAPRGSAPHVAPPRPVSGYARVLLAAMSVLLMPSSPLPAALCYGLSAAMDAVDGMAARWLDQGERDFREGWELPGLDGLPGIGTSGRGFGGGGGASVISGTGGAAEGTSGGGASGASERGGGGASGGGQGFPEWVGLWRGLPGAGLLGGIRWEREGLVVGAGLRVPGNTGRGGAS